MLIPTTNREDMDTAAMIRRAHQAGQELERHDPNLLIGEIADLLRTKGLHPALPPGTGRTSMAIAAGGMLLRAFGILPLGDAQSPGREYDPDPEWLRRRT